MPPKFRLGLPRFSLGLLLTTDQLHEMFHVYPHDIIYMSLITVPSVITYQLNRVVCYQIHVLYPCVDLGLHLITTRNSQIKWKTMDPRYVCFTVPYHLGCFLFFISQKYIHFFYMTDHPKEIIFLTKIQ